MNKFLYSNSICKAFDLNVYEAKIVELLLKTDGISVNEISQNTDINRTTCYQYLKNLKQKNIINIILNNNVKKVYLKDFSNLIINTKEKYAIEHSGKISVLDHLGKIHNNLRSLKVNFKKPKVKLYEGKNSLIDTYKESLNSKSMFVYYNPWKDSSNLEIDKWHARERERRKIPLKLILPKNEKSVDLSEEILEFRETMLMDNFSFNGMKIITNRHVLTYSNNEKIGFCIESEYLANNEIEVFLSIWNMIV